MKCVIITLCFILILNEVISSKWIDGCYRLSASGNLIKSSCKTNENSTCLNRIFKEAYPNVTTIKYECWEKVSSFEFNVDFLGFFINLEKLDLSSLGIEEIYFSKDMKINITTFNASHNSLGVIPKEAFLHMPKLTEIDLSFNTIKFIEKDHFSHASELNKLNLMHNEINVFEIGAFSNLYNLEILDLRNNLIVNTTSKDNNLLKNNTKLRLVNLSGNSLKRFNFSVLSSFDKVSLPSDIEILDMSCNITRMPDLPCHSLNAIENVAGLTQLQNFNGSGNNFENMTILLRKLNHNLKFLDLSGNNITELNDSVLEKFNVLQHLNLSHTSISKITSKAFFNQPVLQSLDLSYNNLLELSFMVASKSIFTLNLEGNKLITVDSITLSMFPHLEWLAINKNQLYCTDLELFFRQWNDIAKLHLVNNFTSQELNVNGVDCHLEAHPKLLNITTPESSGSNAVTISSMILYAIAGVVIILIVVLIAVIVVCAARRRGYLKQVDTLKRAHMNTSILHHVSTTERFNGINNLPFNNENDYEEINIVPQDAAYGYGYNMPADTISTQQTPQSSMSSHLYTLPYGYQLYSTVNKRKQKTAQ